MSLCEGGDDPFLTRQSRRPHFLRSEIPSCESIALAHSCTVKHSPYKSTDDDWIAPGDLSDGGDRFIRKDFVGLGQLMADEGSNLIGGKFIETKARDKQALAEPDAKGWLFQPGKELASCQENRGRYPMRGNPYLLMDKG